VLAVEIKQTDIIVSLQTCQHTLYLNIVSERTI